MEKKAVFWEWVIFGEQRRIIGELVIQKDKLVAKPAGVLSRSAHRQTLQEFLEMAIPLPPVWLEGHPERQREEDMFVTSREPELFLTMLPMHMAHWSQVVVKLVGLEPFQISKLKNTSSEDNPRANDA